VKSLLGETSLFRRINASILLASAFFLSLLSIVVYYSNEALEDELLQAQSLFELEHIRDLLAHDPDSPLPASAGLAVYLQSRSDTRPIPPFLAGLAAGTHHDIELDGKAYHVLIEKHGDDLIYVQYDVTQIERSERLLLLILWSAWIVLLVIVFFIARILSRRLSGPIVHLANELSRIDPDQRGVRLGERFTDDEVGRIARAFDTYTAKMDDYVERQMAFAAMASHELRSPLTIVQTSADLIASRRTDPDILPQIEKIQRATSGMANMIHALLAVTRDHAREQSPQEVLLRPMIDEIAESLEPEFRTKQIELEIGLEADCKVNADPTLLKVVLTNLIRNGLKHGDHSRIVIGMQDSCLSIADTGIGIDAESLSRIFDFGFRGQNSQGYGIGLYISRLICEHQGWKLSLQANPGGGIVANIEFAG